jgi:hypothetical protein
MGRSIEAEYGPLINVVQAEPRNRHFLNTQRVSKYAAVCDYSQYPPANCQVIDALLR